MALTFIGRVLIEEDYSGYDQGDTIDVYWNDTTVDFEVYKNVSTEITSGGFLLVGDGRWHWLESSTPVFVTGSLTGTGNYKTTFEYLSYFPYAKINVEFVPAETTEEAAGEVNDIEISINLITPATGALISDGSFIVTASGTNTPFTYSLTNFVSDGGQSSSTFSGLVPGGYTVSAKDSLGYKASANVLIGFDATTYGIRWWYKEQNTAGTIFKVDILERDYTGSATEVTGRNPFTIKMEGSGGDIYEKGIIPSSAFISLDSTTANQYNDIALADDYKYKIKRYINTSTLQWQGFVLPRTYAKELKAAPYATSFTATDGLGDLKNLDFHTEQDWKYNYKTTIRGRISQLDAFRICLSKLKLSQGFRIACNIFDATHTTTNNSPLNQTNINANYYTTTSEQTRIINNELVSLEEPNYTTCQRVLSDILFEYKAMMVSWEGYWYIVDKEELVNASISYVEYDSVGTYVGTGTIGYQIDFVAAQETDGFRWMGTQLVNTTDVYRNLVLNINLHLKENGILNNPSLKIGNTITVIDEVERITGIRGDSIAISNVTDEVAVTYLLYNDAITYSGTDALRLTVKSLTRLIYGRTVTGVSEGQTPPYLIMRWMLKVGDKYTTTYKSKISRAGTSSSNWSETETINEHYVTNFNGEDDFELSFDFDGVEKTTSTYALRIYVPNLYDYDIEGSTEANMLTAMRGVSTTDKSFGHRIIARYLGTGIHNYFYYELQKVLESNTQDDLNFIEPTDFTDGKWRLVHVRTYPTLSGEGNTETVFSQIKLEQLPEGLEPPEQVQLISELNSKNKVDLELDVNLFDEYSIINNAKNIYDNHTSYTDGTPTSAWTKTGESISKPLQNHLKDWISGLVKRPRDVINGSFTSDIQVTPLSTLKDAGQSNKVYYIQGLTINDYYNQHSGEVIEIVSDSTTSSRAHSSGHKIAAHS